MVCKKKGADKIFIFITKESQAVSIFHPKRFDGTIFWRRDSLSVLYTAQNRVKCGDILARMLPHIQEMRKYAEWYFSDLSKNMRKYAYRFETVYAENILVRIFYEICVPHTLAYCTHYEGDEINIRSAYFVLFKKYAGNYNSCIFSKYMLSAYPAIF